MAQVAEDGLPNLANKLNMKLKTFTNPSIFGDLWKPEVQAKQKSKIDYQKP
jgi:hypothetical protein